ncbi:hypothetical protein [Streptomyces sp. TP-A0356]
MPDTDAAYSRHVPLGDIQAEAWATATRPSACAASPTASPNAS